MALLAQTTLKRDSSFATGKNKKGVPEEAPGFDQVRIMRTMMLNSALQKLGQKYLGSKMLLGDFN